MLVAGVLGNAAFKLIFYPDSATRFWLGDLFGFLLAAAAIGAGLGIAAELSRRTQPWSRAIGWAVPIGISLAETAYLWSGRLGLYGEKRAAVLTGIAATLVAAVAAREGSLAKLVMCSSLVAVITFPIMAPALHLIPGVR